MDEVVVTGTMKEVSRMDSPIPVEIFTPQFFKKNPTKESEYNSLLNIENDSYNQKLEDIKLKENIVDTSSKLDSLMQIKVRNFNLKSNPDLKQIGVIAQELEEVFPSLVYEIPDRDSEGNVLESTTKAVKSSVLTMILIKALQELKQEFDEYKTLH
jgi:hypothetical protein